MTNRLQTGGAIEPGAIYVLRQSDKKLYDALTRGDYCYLMTARQMGKSSMTLRAMKQLATEGFETARIDLQGISTSSTPEQWYGEIIRKLEDYLGDGELEEHYRALGDRTPPARMAGVIEDIIVPRIKKRLVIFIDEVDLTKSLTFNADEFFLRIRYWFERRAYDSSYQKIGFCLVGSALPSELVSNPDISPFNIGDRIELEDFSGQAATVLLQALPDSVSDKSAVLERVFYWTSGQPYLTVALLKGVVDSAGKGEFASVDDCVQDLYFRGTGSVSDKNLPFVERYLLHCFDSSEDNQESSKEKTANLLSLYKQVLEGKAVKSDRHDPYVERLFLSGIAMPDDHGSLRVHCRIYETKFNIEWVRANMPDARWVLEQKRADEANEERLKAEKERQKAEEERRSAVRSRALALVAAAAGMFAVVSLLALMKVREDAVANNVKLQRREAAKDALAKVQSQQLKAQATAAASEAHAAKAEAGALKAKALAAEAQQKFDTKARELASEKGLLAKQDALKQKDLADQARETYRQTMAELCTQMAEQRGDFSAFPYYAKAIEVLSSSNPLPMYQPTKSPQEFAKWEEGLRGEAMTFLGKLVHKVHSSEDPPLAGVIHSQGLRQIAFDPKGKWIACTGLFKTEIYDDKNLKLVATLALERPLLRARPESSYGRILDEGTIGKFSPDGKYFALLDQIGYALFTFNGDSPQRSRRVFQWTYKDADRSQDPVPGRRNEVSVGVAKCVAFARDSSRVAIGGTKGFWVANLSTPNDGRVAPSDGPLSDLNFNPNGGSLAMVVGQDAKVYGIKDRSTRSLTASEFPCNSIRFDSTGRWIVTASDDNTARVWNAQSGQNIQSLKHADSVLFATFSHKGTGAPENNPQYLVTCGKEGLVKVWELRSTGAEPLKFDLKYVFPSDGPVTYAEFSPDDARLVTADGQGETSTAGDGPEGGEAQVWSVTTGNPLTSPLPHPSAVASATFDPQGLWLATASLNSPAYIWSAGSPSLPPLLSGQANAVESYSELLSGQQLDSRGAIKEIKGASNPSPVWSMLSPKPFSDTHSPIATDTYVKVARISASAGDDDAFRWARDLLGKRHLSSGEAEALKEDEDNLDKVDKEAKWMNKGDLYYNSGDYHDGFFAYTKAIGEVTSPDPYYKRGLCSEAMGNKTYALQDFKDAINDNSDKPSVFRSELEMARIYVQDQRPDDALGALNGADPNEEDLDKSDKVLFYSVKGDALRESAKWQDAYAAYSRVLEIDASDPEPLYAQSVCSFHLGNWSDCIKSFLQAVNQNRKMTQDDFDMLFDAIVSEGTVDAYSTAAKMIDWIPSDSVPYKTAVLALASGNTSSYATYRQKEFAAVTSRLAAKPTNELDQDSAMRTSTDVRTILLQPCDQSVAKSVGAIEESLFARWHSLIGAKGASADDFAAFSRSLALARFRQGDYVGASKALEDAKAYLRALPSEKQLPEDDWMHPYLKVVEALVDTRRNQANSASQLLAEVKDYLGQADDHDAKTKKYYLSWSQRTELQTLMNEAQGYLKG